MGKTRAGMIFAFNWFLVHPGLVARRLGNAFGFELNRRIVADDEEGVDAKGALEAIASAGVPVAAVGLVLHRTGEEAEG